MSRSEIDQKREAIKNAYPTSSRWHARVDKMQDSQVIAIYVRLSSQGKLR